MLDIIRPVRFGIIIGLLGLLFGMGWAFWLVLGHERIHQSLESRAATAKAVEDHGLTGTAVNSLPEVKTPVKVHTHADGNIHRHGHEGAERAAASDEVKTEGHHKGPHDSPLMELAHTRLVRGHLHAMGLGLGAVLISIVLAFTSAAPAIKGLASALTGIGGIIYPFAWIVMGYRTPPLGPEAAEASVMVIAGPGVSLVLLGVLTAVFFIAKDLMTGKR